MITDLSEEDFTESLELYLTEPDLQYLSLENWILILRMFWGSMPLNPIDSLEPTLKFDSSLEKSRKCQGISSLLESGNRVGS